MGLSSSIVSKSDALRGATTTNNTTETVSGESAPLRLRVKVFRTPVASPPQTISNKFLYKKIMDGSNMISKLLKIWISIRITKKCLSIFALKFLFLMNLSKTIF